MKYINAVASCYKSISNDKDSILSFNAPFEVMKAVTDEDGLSTDDFTIVTQLNFLGTSKEKHIEENPLEQGKTLDFIIRLTKCDKSEENRLGFDVDKFSIDLNEMKKKKLAEMACFGFLNYTRMTKIDKLSLPAGQGKYVIKILVKYAEDNDSKYQIQAMSGLTIL